MSHVTSFEPDEKDQQIRDLPALARAAERCGLEFREGQTSFHTWATDHGRLVGDWPVPQGYTQADIVGGQCLHAMGIPGKKGVRGTEGYEIGIVESKKNPGTYSMLFDFFSSSLSSKVSSGAKDAKGNVKPDKLHMFYQIEAARTVAKAKGFSFQEIPQPDGSITVKCGKSATF